MLAEGGSISLVLIASEIFEKKKEASDAWAKGRRFLFQNQRNSPNNG